MQNYKLYTVVVIENQPRKKDEEEWPPSVILGPQVVVAKSEQDAAVRLVMMGTLPPEADKERIEVIVRPF